MIIFNQKLLMKSALNFLSILVILISLEGCILFNPKYNPGTVTLKDGTILEGSTFIITNYNFKFKDAKTGKKRKIKNEDVQSLTKKFDDGGVSKYETMNCGGRNILVRIIVDGEISVYQYQVKRTKTRYVSNGSNNQFVPYDYIETFWFVKKNDEDCNLFQLKGLFSDKLNED